MFDMKYYNFDGMLLKKKVEFECWYVEKVVNNYVFNF